MTNLGAAPAFLPTPIFAGYRFFRRLGMFALATLVFFLGAIPAVLLIPAESYLSLAATMGSVALILLALFVWQYRADSRAQLRGHSISKPLRMGALGIIGSYALCGIAIAALGLPQEAFMAEFLAGLTGWQLAIKVASLIVLPPIAEELFFRHYLLRLFPYENSPAWKWIAIIATSAVFAGIHIQYGNWTTVVLIFACGCIFAIARIASGGLLVPILLHSLAEIVALSSDWSFRLMGLYS
ncbi:membrane protease YdiL (CAAX protease family) [Pseudomonas brassicacearum]|uniref:Membrane protease YdiL (CAAX protease family) n=1 Tax=Pseudomonas brassicacearum TaxID=930166 RepID=A0AAW8M870_9PSED|nr:type II CAAX endopeptidase family protein [Pseudomonas brassicacearum]MDR6957656.1 membrane protease YdiL (CAAX protease family) [Pseudomonas brassicacearum]